MSVEFADAPLAEDALAPLEDAVQAALASGDAGALRVVGYGEISPVLLWETALGPVACKRLPPFRDDAALERYREAFHAYLGALAAAGVAVLPSRLQTVTGRDGRRVAYCVQPALAAGAVLPAAVRAAPPAEGERRVGQVLELVGRVVTDRVGLDSQLSNWALEDDRLVYLDVSTPLLRDERGAEVLDIGLFLASLPWALRGVARRFLVQGILDKYYRPRGVVLDLLANLYKEGLGERVPGLLERAGARFPPAFTEAEVRRYYAGDARSWALLQRLRRADRFWQRRVRRRVYPFLLPGRIERHGG